MVDLCPECKKEEADKKTKKVKCTCENCGTEFIKKIRKE